MKTAAIIVAAGRGERMGSQRPKIYLSLGGRPMLARAVEPFLDHPRVGKVVLVVADESAARSALGNRAAEVLLTPGGSRRQDSVRNGLLALSDVEVVLVHDAARPFVDAALIDAVIDAAVRYGAAVPAVAVAATIKKHDADQFVVQTMPRADLALAQTPQGFHYGLLRKALDAAADSEFEATDDAAMVERIGGRVRLVTGSARNIKVTIPGDLDLAEALLTRMEQGEG